MRNRNIILSFIITAASVAGMILSAALIFEYYGITPTSAAAAVCARGKTGIDACAVVSASRFAAIKGIPFIKEIPVAAAGFTFYGIILFIIFLSMIRGRKADKKSPLLLVIILASAALAADIVLYIISAFIIKFLCPLCVMTYIATAIILICSILIYRQNKFNNEELTMNLKVYFKKETVYILFAALILGISATGIGTGAKLMAEKKNSSTYAERLKNAIRQYETTGSLQIYTTNTPFMGYGNAPAHFTVFFDYTCPHCKDEISFLEKLMKKYPKGIAITFKFLPLNGDCGSIEKGRDDPSAEACIAAAAAYCANKQNRFMELTKLLFDSYFEKNMTLNQNNVRELVKKAKLNMTDFDLCFSSKETKDFIKGEYNESEKLGIGSAPTVYLNGKLLTAGLRRNDIIEGLVKYCIEKGK
jgi:protein-disulfide isomerase/uncharacterized membrane protein